jgi:hypothetical protein
MVVWKISMSCPGQDLLDWGSATSYLNSLKFNWHPNILNTALEHPQTLLTLHNENKVTVI